MQCDSFGKDDSIKQDFGTFLNSCEENSTVNRHDMSQLFQKMRYTFVTLGGFVDCKT
jgi:hypothetical protein